MAREPQAVAKATAFLLWARAARRPEPFGDSNVRGRQKRRRPGGRFAASRSAPPFRFPHRGRLSFRMVTLISPSVALEEPVKVRLNWVAVGARMMRKAEPQALEPSVLVAK